jgi:16S rRNA (cytosine1402-N4)-methyltransferase
MLENEMAARGLVGRIDGILLDLGVSSPQFDDAARGFSFERDGPLDMRMDPRTQPSAAEWLDRADAEDIAGVLRDYGEERFARRIARAVVAARESAPIVTTGRLAGIIAAAVPRWEPGKHPATRSFQAIRIFINTELAELEAVLAQSVRVLAKGGRLVVISFHSLEDRIVKRFMRTASQGDSAPADLPIPTRALPEGPLTVIGKALRPSAAEVETNPRARSAIMRVAERR